MSTIAPSDAVQTIIATAKKYLDNGAAMASSAELSHSDALSCLGRGDYKYAADRAIASLSYSIGILHVDYASAKELRRSVFG